MPSTITRTPWASFVEPSLAQVSASRLNLGQVLQEKLAQQGLSGAVDGLLRWLTVGMTWWPHQQVIRAIDGPVSQAVRAAFPRVQYRYTLPYLSNSLNRAERRLALQSHYELVNRHFKPGFYERVLADDLVLWQRGLGDCLARIQLQGLCRASRHREGELTLAFKVDDRTLYKLSFSLVHPGVMARTMPGVPLAAPLVFVGRVQGAAGAMDTIRLVSAQLGDIAPQDLLMVALLGMARAVHAQTIFGVTDGNNVARHCIERSPGSFCYAAFWEKYGAEFMADGNVHLPLPLKERPLSDIAAKHRGRTQRKREAKAAISAEVTQALSRWLV